MTSMAAPVVPAVRIVGNEVRKGLLHAWAERVQILIELPLFIGVTLLLGPLLGAGDQIARGQLRWSLDSGRMSILVVWMVPFLFFYLQVAKMFWRLLGEIQAGTLEQVYLSPLPSWLIAAAGRLVAALAETAVIVAALYAGVGLLVPLHIGRRPAAALPLLLLVIAVVGYWLLIGGLTLVWKRIEMLVEAQGIAVWVLSATALPLLAVPGWMATAGRLVPITPGWPAWTARCSPATRRSPCGGPAGWPGCWPPPPGGCWPASSRSPSASEPPNAAARSADTEAMGGHTLYLVGGAPRVGKSSLAQRLLETDGIPWLPTDVLRTVLRRVLPELDAIDQDPVDAWRLAEVMYPHVEQAAEVCAEEAERFLIEGFELSPSYPARLRAALEGTAVRACFLGHDGFSIEDLAGYRGPKPQHHGASREELREAAAWIRRRSRELRQECAAADVPYVDVGEVGFEAAMARARRQLLAHN